MNPFALSAALPVALLAFAAPRGDGRQGEEPPTCTRVTFSDEYGPDDALWVSPGSAPRLRVPKVVLASGDQLTQVEVTVSGTASGSFGIENLTSNTCIAFPEWSISMGIGPAVPTPGLDLVPFEQSQLVTRTLAPFDGSLDFDGDSGETISMPPGLSFLTVTTLTEELDAFIDAVPGDGTPEYFEFDHFALGNGSARSTCSAEQQFNAQSSVRVDLQYTICSSTEPCPTETVLAVQAGGGGTPVDARERAVLYDLRDKVLSSTPAGQELIRRFYKHAVEAHVLFLNHPDLRTRAAALLRSLLPRLAEAAEGRPAALSEAEQRSIHVLIRDLALHASPELEATLEELRRDLRRGRLSELVGLGG